MFIVSIANPTAGATFAHLPRKAQLEFNRAFDRLALHPRSPGPEWNIHQLSGYQNLWTLRIPPWRGIYALDGEAVVMIVFGRREIIYPTLHSLLPPEGRYVADTSIRHLPRRTRKRG